LSIDFQKNIAQIFQNNQTKKAIQNEKSGHFSV